MLGQLLVKLANYLLQLFQQLATKSIDDGQFLTFVNERTSSFLQFLLLLNQHPFHLLSLNSYQALNAFIIRQPTLLSNEPFCLKLIENLKASLHRVHFPSSPSLFIDNGNEMLKKQYEHNQKSFIYALYEYDSEEQFYWKFFSQYRTELQKLIKSFIGMFFPDAVNGKKTKKRYAPTSEEILNFDPLFITCFQCEFYDTWIRSLNLLFYYLFRTFGCY